MMRQSATISFVGPLSWDGRSGRHEPCYFVLLQSTGQALKLEYANQAEAIRARRQLNTGKDAHFVHSTKLLLAIQASLQAALASLYPKPKHHGSSMDGSFEDGQEEE
jgi:hypothetical protein